MSVTTFVGDGNVVCSNRMDGNVFLKKGTDPLSAPFLNFMVESCHRVGGHVLDLVRRVDGQSCGKRTRTRTTDVSVHVSIGDDTDHPFEGFGVHVNID